MTTYFAKTKNAGTIFLTIPAAVFDFESIEKAKKSY